MAADARQTAPEPGSRLRGYGARRRELAELLEAAMHLATEEGDPGAERQARRLLSNLADDRFQLAVVGQFSRGKSTLMNAILGGAYLPAGALPMTSVVTTVRYGSKVQVEVHPDGEALPISTTLDDLPRYIAQSSPERERLRVVAATIELPAEILRLGFSFVDTPGVGSAVAANTQTTQRYLPDADAVVFVTSAESPLTADEMGLLARARGHGRRLFFVLNKIDLVAAADLPALITFVRDRLDTEEDGTAIPTFAVSARWGLEGRENNDPARVDASGVSRLEAELARFLTTEKSRQLLLRTADRTRDLVQRQRLEPATRISLGHSGIDSRLKSAVDQRVNELCEEERQAVHRLTVSLDQTLCASLRERLPRWTNELEQYLAPYASAAVGSTESRALVMTRSGAGREFDRLAYASVQEWGLAWAGEVRSMVADLARPALAILARHRDAAGDAVLSVLGADLAPCARPTFESPEAAVRGLTFDAPHPALVGDWPWWTAVVPRAWSRGRLLEWAAAAARAGIARSLGQAIDGAVDAAVSWAEAWGAQVQEETRRAARELQDRLLTERPTDLRRFDALLERLDQFTTALQLPPTDGLSEAAPTTGRVPGRKPCPICSELDGVLSTYLASVQFDLLHDQDRRAEHARGGGFCPLHTWQYARMASPIGIATTYAPVAERAAALLREGAEPRSQAPSCIRSAGILVERKRCPACLALAEAERRAVAAILSDRTWQEDRAAPPALCVPHLATVVAAQPPPDAVQRLRLALAATLERAAEDMRGYALKRDSFRRDLITEEESNAAIRALGRLVGSQASAMSSSGRDEI